METVLLSIQFLMNLVLSFTAVEQLCIITITTITKVKVRSTAVPVLKHHTMKTYEEAEFWLHVFLTLALDEGENSASHSGCFTSWKNPWYTSDIFGRPQGWVQHGVTSRPGLDMVSAAELIWTWCRRKNPWPCYVSTHSGPAHRQSLYWPT
jgi:hypothetical protein